MCGVSRCPPARHQGDRLDLYRSSGIISYRCHNSSATAGAETEVKKLEARELLIIGQKPEEIATKTGLPMKTINAIGNWLKAPEGQKYILATKTMRENPDPTKVAPPIGGKAMIPSPETQPPRVPTPMPATPLRYVDPASGREMVLAEGTQVEDEVGQSYMLVQTPDARGNPLNARITPWVLIWYGVADAEAKRAGLQGGYTGGVTQFIEDCVRSYMKMNGKRFTYVSEVD